MNVISVIIYAAELAVAAIILFYVVEMLTMPANMKRVCQGLSGSDSSDRYPVGDRNADWFCSATGITCRTASAELTEQSQRRPVMTPSRAAGIFAV
jgi:hypothetical protein